MVLRQRFRRHEPYPCAQAEESASFPADASTQPPFLIVCTHRKTARVHVFYKVIFMIRAGRPLPLLIFPIVVTQFSCSSRRISRLALRSVIPISSASFAEVIFWSCFRRISFASPQTWVLAMKNPRILRGLRRFYRNDQDH